MTFGELRLHSSQTIIPQLETKVSIQGLLLPKSDNDTGAEAKVVLDIVGSIGQLCVLPGGFDCTHSDMLRKPVVEPAAGLGCEAVGAGLGSSDCRKEGLEAIRLANQASDSEIAALH
jgi:hypothetical protein